MPPTVPINHYFTFREPKTERKSYQLFHAEVFKAKACFEHSNFLKVNGLQWQVRANECYSCTGSHRSGPCIYSRYSTTSVLTATTLIYAIGAGITAAAGTRLALQLFLIETFRFYSLQSQSCCLTLLFLVTTSLCQNWVIYAPAAILRRGSRFSGSLSGIEP
jgi:hypothetical protein